MVESDKEEIYFQCPNCQTTYDLTSFHDLEHTSYADPSLGPQAVGHAQCRNCRADFYYYLNSEGFPIIVKNDPVLMNQPPADVVNSISGQMDIDEVVQIAPVKLEENKQRSLVTNERDKMGQFEQALDSINKDLSPDEYNKKISEALEIIIHESPPQIEAGFSILKKKLGLNSLNVAAFRKEVNSKREKIEIDEKMHEIEAVFSKITQPSKNLSEQEKTEAIEYLKDPNLFDNISRDIAIAGEVVGEETNKMMLYLAATSRKFKKPISLVVFGKSSSGKSYVANTIERFMPDEDTLVLSSMTAKALEYADDQLMHKCLLVQEWEGLKEALPTLRVLQSEGKLSRLVTIIDPIAGKRRAVPHEQDCPCTVIVTTTQEGIHNENSTRIFELYADESVEQTENVVRQNLLKADISKRVSEEEKNRILGLHHNVQRVLEPVEVNIPFAGYLTFPAKTTRHRRDSDRFINLIKAVAFLRQKQKEQLENNGIKYIDADIDDYKISYEIGKDIIKSTLNESSDRVNNAFRVCCLLNERLLDDGKDPWFSVSNIRDTAPDLDLDFKNRDDIYKQMAILEEYEYLERRQSGKGTTKYYKVIFPYERNEAGEITNIDSPDFKEILTPEQLEEKIRNQDGSVEMLRESPYQQKKKLLTKDP